VAEASEVRDRSGYVLTLSPDQVVLRTRREIGLLPFGCFGIWVALAVFPLGLPLLIRYLDPARLPVFGAEIKRVFDGLHYEPCLGLFLAPFATLVGLWAFHASFQRKEILLEGAGPLRVIMHRFGESPQEWTVPRTRVRASTIEKGALIVGQERWLLELSPEDEEALESSLRTAAGGEPRPERVRSRHHWFGGALAGVALVGSFCCLLFDGALGMGGDAITFFALSAMLLMAVWVKPLVRLLSRAIRALPGFSGRSGD
jgi:hypothetical protein